MKFGTRSALTPAGWESMVALLDPLRLYDLSPGSFVSRELMAYAAGLALFRQRLEQCRDDLFLATCSLERLARWEELLDLPVLEWAFRGIRAAVAVLVLEAGAKMLLKLRKKPQGRSLRTGLAAVGFGLALLARVLGWPVSTIELMLLAGIAGVLLFRETPAGKGAENP